MGQSWQCIGGRSTVSGVASDGRFRAARRRLLMALAAGCVAVGIGGTPVATANARTAIAARTVSLREFGSLRLTSKQGFTLNERGNASGTITGTIYIHLHVISSRSVTAEVNIYPTSGSLSGSGSASYHVNGAQALFNGTLAIGRGSGRYAHAHASRLAFTGTIQRRNDAVSVQLSGPLSY